MTVQKLLKSINIWLSYSKTVTAPSTQYNKSAAFSSFLSSSMCTCIADSGNFITVTVNLKFKIRTIHKLQKSVKTGQRWSQI